MKVGKYYEISDYHRLPEYISKVIPRFFMVSGVDHRNNYVDSVISMDGTSIDSEVMVFTKYGIRFFHIPECFYSCFSEVEIVSRKTVPHYVDFHITIQ